MSTQDLQTIQGYILAVPRTTGKEESSRVAVVTEDGTEYHVLHKGAGAGLAGNISANVEVTGTVSPLMREGEQPPGFLLQVRSYRLTDGYDDPWYDDAVS